jgi:HK97 family phage portal protein
MFQWINKIISRTGNETKTPVDELEREYFAPYVGRSDAKIVSPFYQALTMYQNVFSVHPQITYKKDKSKSRSRAESHPSFYVLSERPNPGMSRAVLWDMSIDDLFVRGEFFHHIIWSGSGKHKYTLPIPVSAVVDVKRDPRTWKKKYVVSTSLGQETLEEEDVVHVMLHPNEDGLRGVSLTKYAADSMSLHTQVRDAGAAFFRNAVRPGQYVTFPGNVAKEAAKELCDQIDEKHAGAKKRGGTFYLTNGGEMKPLNDQTAEEARIIEALNSSVADCARWFNLDPQVLGDGANNKYNSLEAANQALYQKSYSPLLSKIELEYNAKLFGVGSDYYSEFLVEAMLKGDPKSQAEVDSIYLAAKVYLPNEVRAWKNMPDLPETAITPAPDATTETPEDQQPDDTKAAETATTEAASTDQTAAAADGAVQQTGLNGAQIASLLAICDKVALREYPAPAAIQLILASFPLMDVATVTSIVNAVAAFEPPKQPEPEQPQPEQPQETNGLDPENEPQA